MPKIFSVIIGAFLGGAFGEYQLWKSGLFSRSPWVVAIPPIACVVVVIVVWKFSKKRNV
jgi:ABC-type dipeptide/oligopeptide/nickel transport system permease subunit